MTLGLSNIIFHKMCVVDMCVQVSVCAGVSMCRYMDVYKHVCLYAGGHVCASMCTYLEGIVVHLVCQLVNQARQAGQHIPECAHFHLPHTVGYKQEPHTWLFTWLLASCLCDTLLNELSLQHQQMVCLFLLPCFFNKRA